jgi:hypothetical protein
MIVPAEPTTAAFELGPPPREAAARVRATLRLEADAAALAAPGVTAVRRPGRTRALFIELQAADEGDPSSQRARDSLVEAHLPLVEHLAAGSATAASPTTTSSRSPRSA